MRICSLVPGATEVVAALGLADQLVGISHECDFPSTVRHAPVMIETNVGKGQALSAEIDRQVKELVSAGQNLYRLDEQASTGPDFDASPVSRLRRDPRPAHARHPVAQASNLRGDA